MTDPSRVCVASGGDEVRWRSYVNHTVFAREHGFTHHIGIGLAPGIETVYFYKFELIREILPHFEWVLYLDDDVYITNFASESIEHLIARATGEEKFAVFAEGPPEPDGSWTRLNSGVILLRNDPRSFAFLDRAQRSDREATRSSWS